MYMIYSSKDGDIKLEGLKRLYPAVLVRMNQDEAEMSLEWCELYGEKVEILSYILVFDYTPQGENLKDRVVLRFASQDELIDAMNEVARFF